MAVMKVINKNASDIGCADNFKEPDSYKFEISDVIDPEKTGNFIGGWGVCPYFAVEDMRHVTELYHEEPGVELKHWTFSFTVDEINACARKYLVGGPDILLTIAYNLTSCYKDRHQIVFGVHCNNNPHPQIHIVMNATSYWDGKKFEGNQDQYNAYVEYARDTLDHFGMDLETAEAEPL